MKKTIILIIGIIVTSISLNAQINEKYTLNPNDLTVQTYDEYDLLEVAEHSYTEEVGNPQLPVKVGCS